MGIKLRNLCGFIHVYLSIDGVNCFSITFDRDGDCLVWNTSRLTQGIEVNDHGWCITLSSIPFDDYHNCL